MASRNQTPVHPNIEAAPEPSAQQRIVRLFLLVTTVRDADLAEAFGTYSQMRAPAFLSPFAHPTAKNSGIEYGKNGTGPSCRKLDDATDVVACQLPKHQWPWILYETGVAKGKLTATIECSASRSV